MSILSQWHWVCSSMIILSLWHCVYSSLFFLSPWYFKCASMIILSLWISVCSSLWEPGCVPQLGFNLPPEDKKLHLWDVTPTKWISLFSILSNNNSVARLPIGHTSHALFLSLSQSLSPTYLRTLTHTPTHAHTFLPLSRTHSLSLSLSLSLALLWWGQFLDSPLTHPSTPFWLICSYYCCFVKKNERAREQSRRRSKKKLEFFFIVCKSNFGHWRNVTVSIPTRFIGLSKSSLDYKKWIDKDEITQQGLMGDPVAYFLKAYAFNPFNRRVGSCLQKIPLFYLF